MTNTDSAVAGRDNTPRHWGDELVGAPAAESGAGRRALRILVAGAGIGGLAVARGLVRSGCEVTIFEQATQVRAGGGAVTIWPNGAAVLDHLGVDMRDAGQRLSRVRVRTSAGQRITTIDLRAVNARMGGNTLTVPCKQLLVRLLDGFPAHRIQYDNRVVGVADRGVEGVRVRLAKGRSAEGDLLIGADGRNSLARAAANGPAAMPAGWCSWQGLGALPDAVADDVAWVVVGDAGNLGMWPAGEQQIQCWFDLPRAPGFKRPVSPIALLRASFDSTRPGKGAFTY